MDIEEFQKFIDEQDALFRTTKQASHTERERVLARTVKISEEFGELCDEVLASLGDQRTGKMDGRSAESLADEFADVVITTFLLAKSMEVDVMGALSRKTEKIRAKHNKQLGEV
ncbi:MAG: MazG nucleotide pyrophosphohydrolase domain-containing protein [Candidatus Paceibacterota bacterium]|jgi:NTP pyrophosphatase (non-canonical NTP hydrolase)